MVLPRGHTGRADPVLLEIQMTDKERPSWCIKEDQCEYVYSVGEICIGCMTGKEYLRPWKNAYSLCFGAYSGGVTIRTVHLLGLFKCIKEAVAFEKAHDYAPKTKPSEAF